MMFGLFLVPLLAGAGVAIDMLRTSSVKAELREAVDAGLLAAARANILDASLTEAEARDIALRFFEDNTNLTQDVEINQFNLSFDLETDQYVINLQGRMRTAFLGVVGHDYVPININTEATISTPGPVEVALVLDNTGSMKGKRLKSLKESATLLVETLLADDSGKFKVGLVPFAQYVNVGEDNADAFWLNLPNNTDEEWEGCVGSRSAPANVNDGLFDDEPAPAVVDVRCPQAVFPLTANKDAILPQIKDMKARGSTYIPGGLTWGRRVLSSQAPFTEGVTDAELDANDGIKAVVLLTDGANTRSPSFPLHDIEKTYPADQLTENLCNDIENDGYRIYTIAFEIEDQSTEDLMRVCASDDGAFFDAGNPQMLQSAFASIANDLVNIALTQ